MKKRVKIANGWVLEIGISAHIENYTIEKVLALFGHGVYFTIDLQDITQEQWGILHERIKEARQ